MSRIVVLIMLVVALAGCQKSISAEDAALVQLLRTEQLDVRKEIDTVEVEAANYSGGLILSLLSVRLEILKTTDALISQRIVALESGAPVNLVIPITEIDEKRASELSEQIVAARKEIVAAQAEADRYSGGLIQAVALSTVATMGQSIAMLEQERLVAKYGLQSPRNVDISASEQPAAVSDAPIRSENLRDGIISVRLLRKEYSEQDYQEYIFFDIELIANGLDKPTRAIKGKMKFQDLFGETKLSVGWTVDVPMSVGDAVTEKGMGFEYNQFIDSHQWVKNTRVEDMKAIFSVESIIYEDGSRRDID